MQSRHLVNTSEVASLGRNGGQVLPAPAAIRPCTPERVFDRCRKDHHHRTAFIPAVAMQPAIAPMMEQIMYKAYPSLVAARPNDDSDTNEPHDMQLPRLVATHTLPFRRTISRTELRQIVPLSDTTIYDIERRGEFPRRFNLTARCVVWDLAENRTTCSYHDWSRRIPCRSDARSAVPSCDRSCRWPIPRSTTWSAAENFRAGSI